MSSGSMGHRAPVSLPNEDSIVRRVDAVLREANDAAQPQPRYVQVEARAELDAPTAEPRNLVPTTHAA
jgi:hypothetical protein